MVSGAIAAKRAMADFGLKGTLKVFGAPGEEQLISRPYYVRDGWFDDVDVALHDHIGGDMSTVYGLTHAAAVSAYFTFRGETAHASTAPWRARDALDGVVLMDMGMAQFREHMEPDMRAHRVIKDGGDQPNTIPAKATGLVDVSGPNGGRRPESLRTRQKDRRGRRDDDQYRARG